MIVVKRVIVVLTIFLTAFLLYIAIKDHDSGPIIYIVLLWSAVIMMGAG